MNIRLKDIMTKQADYLSPNASLQEASTEMQKHDIGFLPIKENGTLVGVVTDRDITIRGISKGLDPNATLDKVMTKKVITARDSDTLEAAARLMEQKQIRRLVITDSNNAIAGVVSLGDIATKCQDADLCAHILSTISQKSH